MKLKYSLILIMIACLMFSGCSYSRMEDSFRRSVQKLFGNESTKVEYDAGEYLEDLESEAVEQEDSNIDNREEDGKIKGIGESHIAFNIAYGWQMEYALLDVKVGKNIQDLNLSKEYFFDLEDVNEDGSLKLIDDKETLIVVATVKVQNKNVDLETARTKLKTNYPFGIENGLSQESDIIITEEDYRIYTHEACYFSGRHENASSDFFFFALEKGEEMTVDIAWIVTEEMWKEDCYYLINSNTNVELLQYFKLN